MTFVVADSSSSCCCHPTKPLVFAQCTEVRFASFLSGGSNESTGKETEKKHLCAVAWFDVGPETGPVTPETNKVHSF